MSSMFSVSKEDGKYFVKFLRFSFSFRYRMSIADVHKHLLAETFEEKFINNFSPKKILALLHLLIDEKEETKALLVLQAYYKKHKLKKLCGDLVVANFLCRNGYKNPQIEKESFVYEQLNKNMNSGKLQNFLKEKTVAIVGNSGIQIGKNTGSEIDNHDIVIRFNNYPDGYENDYGAKCNIWVRGFGAKDEIKSRPLENLDFVLFSGNLYKGPLADYIIDWLYDTLLQHPDKIYFLTKEFFSSLEKYSLKAPTGGFLIIMYVALYAPKEDIDFYGFSFLSEDHKDDNAHYYDNKCNLVGHSIYEERDVLKKLFIKKETK